jgi:thioredoxin-dependent peroxiredoxin
VIKKNGITEEGKMANDIKVGDKVPNFSIKDYEGVELESSDLLGSPYVLYFYPKDDTPGCTTEACSFRDHMEFFDDLETLVLGVSPDSAESHHHFIQKHNLNFTLLCDEHMELAKLFGVTQEKDVNGKKVTGIVRSTFVVNADGVVHWREKPVNVEEHTKRVLEAVKHVVK